MTLHLDAVRDYLVSTSEGEVLGTVSARSAIEAASRARSLALRLRRPVLGVCVVLARRAPPPIVRFPTLRHARVMREVLH